MSNQDNEITKTVSSLAKITTSLAKRPLGAIGKYVSDFVTSDKNRPSRGDRSIRTRNKDSIMQFPVIISSSIDKRIASILNSALEVEYGLLMRISIQNSEIIDLGEMNPGDESLKGEFLRKFHTNNHQKEDLMKLYDDIIDGMNESKEPFDPMIPFTENFTEDTLNDLTIPHYLRENLYVKDITISEATEDDDLDVIKNHSMTIRDERELNRENPTVLTVKARYRINGNLYDTEISFAIQCITHVIENTEMVENIGKSFEYNNIFFRAIKWTTGEISFMRDFILKLDEVKEDNVNTKQSRWWHFLKQEARMNRNLRKTPTGSGFIPNTTFILSIEEVDFIKNKTGIDLMESNNVDRLFRIYGLLGLVIYNGANNSAYFYDPVNKTFSIKDLISLDRDLKKLTLKKLSELDHFI